MKILITGKKSNEREFSQNIETELTQLDLSENQLRFIDLTPLQQCTKLTQLYLFSNQLQSIDLSPLQQCTKLTQLYLFSNHLQSIDLSPLQQCTELTHLNLRVNHLQSIDLSPLQQCTKLTHLNLKQYTDISRTKTNFPELIWTVPIQDLPSGLKKYSDKLKQAWKKYKLLAEKEASSKILDYINRIRPNIPISIDTIAEIANIERKQLARILSALVKQNTNIGEYLELEQVFIKKTETDVELDKLLQVFKEFERTGEGKKG